MTVSSSPHMREYADTRSLMADVLVALFFPLCVAVYFFGPRALTLTLLSIAACVASEAIYRKITKKPQSVGDLSAAVTGVLIAFVMPAATPYWLILLGDVFAIIVVKQLYGGLGKNFLNPALAARVLMSGFDEGSLFTAALPEKYLPLWSKLDLLTSTSPDVVTTATPLAGTITITEDTFPNLLLGETAGCIGEVSSAVLLLGGLYLIVRKVITPRIPFFYMATVALLTFFFHPTGLSGLQFMLYSLLSGGLILGAVFMATDYVTSPVTKKGQIMFAIGCGLLTVLFRMFSHMPEGVCFSILLMNTLTWSLDKIGKPKVFGKRKKKEA